jgi:chemotaxis protein histidine kinase CheA/CheY-like chemotaxis protein
LSEFNISSFIASFFDEAKDRLASINQHLVALESGSLDEEGLNSLRRDAHTIKGSALMLGVTDVGEMGHLFEDAMEKLIEHAEFRTGKMVQFLFDLHDRLVERLQHPDGQELLDVDKYRRYFNALCDDIAVEPSSGSAASIGEELQSLLEEAAAAEAETLLIGAEEAEAWRRAGAEPLPEAESPPEAATTEVAGEGEEEIPDHADMAFAAENTGDFRPDISKFEMQTLGARQSSGRYLRVDADRLAMLSNQVMELSIENARSLGMLEQFSDLNRGMRELRRHWRQLQAYLAPLLQLRGLEEDNELQALEGLFERHLKQVQRFGDDLRYERDRGAIVLNDIRDQILGLMLRPLDSVFSTFPRAVRDTAMRFNRKVRLQIGGKSVEMDQGVAEALVEPLIHLLNNAIAHGIEAPEERLQAGKPEEGLVSILAKQSGSEVHIEVVDDGRGIDVNLVRDTAIRRGVTTRFEADQMDSAEILEMIFRPGFSTHEDVDSLAGRGIGMNVVQDTVRKLTGSVRIHTEKGRGTRFLLSLPVSIAVQHALQFRIGDQRFGMLTHMIEQVMPLDTFEAMEGQGESGHEKASIVRYGKHHLSLVDLRHVLHLKRHLPEGARPYVVIAEHIEGYVGIVVDELFEESEIIVRDIDPYLKRYQAPGLMGNTIVSDGSVLLLIEPYGIKEMGRTAPDMSLQNEYAARQAEMQTEAVAEGAATGEEAPAQPRVLLVEDSLIAREIEKGMLQSAGFHVRTAIDGVDALEKIRSERYDLIVTDLEMPRLDGFGLVRQIRNESRFEDMPILVISTRESAEDRMRALDAGADAYLVKQQLSHGGLRDALHKFFGSLTPGADSNTNRPLEKAPIV